MNDTGHARAVQDDLERRVQELAGPDPAASADLLADVLRGFVDSLPGDLAALAAAINDRDAQALREGAHRVKSAACNIGATGVASLSGELEGLGAGAPVGQLVEAMGRLRAEAETVEQAATGVVARLRG